MDNIIKKSSDKYVASKLQLFLHKNGRYNLPVHLGRNKNNSDCLLFEVYHVKIDAEIISKGQQDRLKNYHY